MAPILVDENFLFSIWPLGLATMHTGAKIRIVYFKKITFWKSQIPQNSRFENPIFDEIHIYQTQIPWNLQKSGGVAPVCYGNGPCLDSIW